LNPGRLGGKLATNRLSYGAAYAIDIKIKLNSILKTLYRAELLLRNDRDMDGYNRAVSWQQLGKHFPAAIDTNARIEHLCQML
jgi:hypothetical protein